MDCKKIVEIVAEDISDYVATIWTGANYYIDCFSKKAVYAQIESAYESGISLSVKDVIRSRSVSTMRLMCRDEDFTTELQKEWFNWFQEATPCAIHQNTMESYKSENGMECC